MKKLFLITLTLVMILGFAACGGETAAPSTAAPSAVDPLVEVTTEQGISLKLPNDMTKQSAAAYVNTKTGDSATFGVAEVTKPITEWKEENVLATYKSKYPDAQVLSFGNGIEINGKEALVSMVTWKTPKGNEIISTLVMVTDGKTNYIISLNYGDKSLEGLLAKNLEACIESIKVK